MPGYFAPDSMAVRVMSNRAVGLTYGQRALVIGAVHPRLFVGTVENTSHRETPYNRLALTARLFETVFLGSKDEADRALEFTRRKHATVVGDLPEDAGTHYPAGTHYDANDPYLMYMTMAFAFDSVDTMQNLLVRKLTPAEREALWQDFVTWAGLFGMPREAAPATYAAFRTDFDGYLASDKPFLNEEAKVIGSYLAGTKRGDYNTPPPLRPLFRTIELVVQGSLPRKIRDMYGFRWTPAHAAAFRGVVAGTRALHVQPPLRAPHPLQPVLHGKNSELLKVVANQERRQLRRGRRSMPEATDMRTAASERSERSALVAEEERRLG